jgi:hypothetical protein
VDRDVTGGLTQDGWTLKAGSVAAASSTGQLDDVPYGRCDAQSRPNRMGLCLRENRNCIGPAADGCYGACWMARRDVHGRAFTSDHGDVVNDRPQASP